MARKQSFDAFLSYSHADSRHAVRLQRYLESYPLPGRPKLRVYLDATDIRSGDLSGELQLALRDSRSLLVCCSPSTRDSRWVAREIKAFGAPGKDGAIVPIVIGGEPDQVLPAAIKERENRYLDLRGGWWLGLLSPKARVELTRGIATIAGLSLRELIDWEKRRQRRFVAFAATLALLLLVAALIFPLHYQRPIDFSGVISPMQTLEFVEVQGDDAFLVTAREVSEGPQGTRNYVECYPDALGSEERHWLGDGPCLPRTRVLPLSILSYRDSDTLADRFDFPALFARARKLNVEQSEELLEERGQSSDDLPDPAGPWVGEPYPGLSIALVTIPPPPSEPADEIYTGAPVGDALIAVASAQGGLHVARVVGCEPGSEAAMWDARSADLKNGLSVAARGDEIWLGLPLRADGGQGGLWHSLDAGASWAQEGTFAGVASLALVPGNGGRVLVATAPGDYRSGIRQFTSEAQCWERGAANKEWAPLEPAPPFSAVSNIHFAGFLSDGSWVIQVDSAVYRLGRDNLARRLLESLR